LKETEFITTTERDEAMKFAINKNGANRLRDAVTERLIEKCESLGYQLSTDDNDVDFIFNLTSANDPKSFRRRSKSVFVITIIADQFPESEIKSASYRTLIRTLSNLLLCAVQNRPSNGEPGDKIDIQFTTPEAGFYHLPFNPDEIYDRIHPIISSHFATDNIFFTDLPSRFRETSPVIEKIKQFGKELDNLGILPTPFPLKDFLPENDMRHIYKIYGITGASYGNLSARESIPELGKNTFWMTGRGIDKSNISKIGKDVLMVKAFDYKSGAALISMPLDYDLQARVSVDAVEHALIYKTFPEVGAIVHAHAWIPGVNCTRQNYPCGTRELAQEVVDLLKRADKPARTAVGLKNHGLTITGENLDEIFSRIRGKLVTEVAMFP